VSELLKDRYLPYAAGDSDFTTGFTPRIAAVRPSVRGNGDAADVLLTAHDVAQLLNVPVSWDYERTRRRGIERLPHLKIGKYLRFRRDEIESYLENLRRG